VTIPLAREMRRMYISCTMSRYGDIASAKSTPQTERAHPDQVANSAGGFAFAVDCWKRLDRFLVLGAEGGSYYATERKIVLENARTLRECIALDGRRTVRRIVQISEAGRAPKNDPAIFALAVCASAKDPETRAAALAALPAVCRIGTHLFHFMADVTTQRNWSRALRNAVAKWYTERDPNKLALQLAKYQQRDGWSHKDAMRLSHPRWPSQAHRAAAAWTMGAPLGDEPFGGLLGKHGLSRTDVIAKNRGTKAYHQPLRSSLPALLVAVDELHALGKTDVKRSIALIREHHVPHECIPNELKDQPEVWEALLDGMGQTALIRQLSTMTRVGLLKPLAAVTTRVCEMLTDKAALFKGRVHPLAVLIAQSTYAKGHGVKGTSTWTPVPTIIDALDEAFYLSFAAIEPTNKRTLLSLDVSGSMALGTIGGSHLTPREASAAMAMVTARTEKDWAVMAFGQTFQEVHITPRMRLDTVVKAISDLPFGRTDCSLPMKWATLHKIDVDAFVVYTDSETYAGVPHPHQALAAYRRQTGIAAKLVVVGMVANEFTIADPSDAGMLDVVGFDASAPAVMADFIADREVVS